MKLSVFLSNGGWKHSAVFSSAWAQVWFPPQSLTFTGLLGILCLLDLVSSAVNIGQQMKQPVTAPTGRWVHELITSVLSLKLHFFMVLTKVNLCTKTHTSQHTVRCLLYSCASRSTESFRAMWPRTVKTEPWLIHAKEQQPAASSAERSISRDSSQNPEQGLFLAWSLFV